MIRTTAVPRSAKVGTALVGVAGMLALAGCAATADADAAGGPYADGTYTAEGSYATPESVETISVTLTIADDIVTDVEVVGDPQKQETEVYQAKFIGGISDEVVGKDLNGISVSRVAGSSLTSGGFNKAVEDIKQQAAA